MARKTRGQLIIIGGAEERTEGERGILRQVAEQVNGRSKCLVLVTVATQHPQEVAAEYRHAFKGLGVTTIRTLDVRTRQDAFDEEKLKLLDGAAAIFFTGGDQLRITSQLGDSPIFQRLWDLYQDGVVIVGTSAGAAAMPATMLIAGQGDQSHGVASMDMAPGLGFLDDVVIDSHFAERGRMGRLLSAVAQNPKNLGIGIDENTAIHVQDGNHFSVLGSGAVYVVDGSGISYSSLSDFATDDVLSIHDLKLHVLAQGGSYDLLNRQPIAPKEKERTA